MLSLIYNEFQTIVNGYWRRPEHDGDLTSARGGGEAKCKHKLPNGNNAGPGHGAWPCRRSRRVEAIRIVVLQPEKVAENEM